VSPLARRRRPVDLNWDTHIPALGVPLPAKPLFIRISMRFHRGGGVSACEGQHPFRFVKVAATGISPSRRARASGGGSMRYSALLFLMLAAMHAPQRGRHPMPSSFQIRPHDGSSATNFGRQFRRDDAAALPREQLRIDRFEMGNGTQLGVGLVHGRHLGFKFKLPF
jgi:hypothetical protein